MFSASDLEAALRDPDDRHQPRSRLVAVEQTTNIGGGRVWSPDSIDAVLEVARRRNLRTHLDGARLLNAAVASGEAPATYAAGFDTAWIDFSKGLGAPVGACLAGSREQRIADYGELRRELIGIEREELLGLRGSGRLRNSTMRQIERDLDLEEARIRS